MNYNTDLQSNNLNLQNIHYILNSLPDKGTLPIIKEYICTLKGKSTISKLIEEGKMLIDFTDVMSVSIPEGEVSKITCDNEILWKAISAVPDEYQQVEYIGVSGTQYINTNWTPSNNTYFKIRFMATTSSYMFGSGSAPRLAVVSNSNNIQVYNTDNGAYGIYNFSDVNFNTVVDLETFTTTTLNEAYVKANGVEKRNDNTSINVNFNSSFKMLLGAWQYNAATIRYGKGRIYSATAKVDNVLIFDMIPCYRISDGEIGMWDTVSKTFFTNAGTGTFTKGSDV